MCFCGSNILYPCPLPFGCGHDSAFICENLCRFAHTWFIKMWMVLRTGASLASHEFYGSGADHGEIKLLIDCLAQADLVLSRSGRNHHRWCENAENIFWCWSIENLLFLNPSSGPYQLMKFPDRDTRIMQYDCMRAHRCHWYACPVPFRSCTITSIRRPTLRMLGCSCPIAYLSIWSASPEESNRFDLRIMVHWCCTRGQCFFSTRPQGRAQFCARVRTSWTPDTLTVTLTLGDWLSAALTVTAHFRNGYPV